MIKLYDRLYCTNLTSTLNLFNVSDEPEYPPYSGLEFQRMVKKKCQQRYPNITNQIVDANR